MNGDLVFGLTLAWIGVFVIGMGVMLIVLAIEVSR